ncbi:MAG: response regulator transcription factor [Candidatus Omnitrophica bacterium]|nr:response regulator transcription factor [Candidatus Omnitrophota bacterium]MDE2213739.1 response regulator transcription factor [Candidatus Omnitrophota bacterium]MDE2230686.1 response regulator transcription factor [Candidatus Omnitrophota bacterium]
MVSTILEPQQEQQTPRSKPLIMIVDDNVELLEELENLLKLGGYDVAAISDGTQVLETALKNKPDLILLDLKMSPKSGFQIADEARNSIVLKDVPVIAMTGFFTEKQHFLMMKLCGIKTSILKPFRPLNLITKIEFALGKREEEYETDMT